MPIHPMSLVGSCLPRGENQKHTAEFFKNPKLAWGSECSSSIFPVCVGMGKEVNSVILISLLISAYQGESGLMNHTFANDMHLLTNLAA